MAQQRLIQIDLERIRTNFERTDRRLWTESEVRGWLSNSGFLRHERGWICDEDALTLFDKSEIISMEAYD